MTRHAIATSSPGEILERVDAAGNTIFLAFAWLPARRNASRQLARHDAPLKRESQTVTGSGIMKRPAVWTV
ncbi:MAG: hypothetical protein U0075_21850 [Thermomicrobiales bacterium]